MLIFAQTLQAAFPFILTILKADLGSKLSQLFFGAFQRCRVFPLSMAFGLGTFALPCTICKVELVSIVSSDLKPQRTKECEKKS